MKYDPRLLLNYFARLAPRERLLLGVAGLSVVAISLYSFVWDPLQTNRTLLATRIAKKERDLIAIQGKRDDYLEKIRRLESNQAAIPELDPKFPGLFAYLQTIIAQAVPHEHIVSMNPSSKNIGNDFQEDLVEIKLNQISLPQLVDLMYRVEKGEPPLRFSRLSVKKRYNDIRNFDVTATVSLLKWVHS
jgi:hypothetical protein